MGIDMVQCNEALHELAVAISAANPGWLSDATHAHLSLCAHCRAILLLLPFAGSTPPPLPTHTTCMHCQDNLAAFIDLERGDAAVAAERYPAVWWHLWLCADCAEVYSLTCELLAAETSRTHRRQLTATPAIFWLPRIVIEREVLKVMLPRRFDSMLVARGDDTRHALFDETLDTKAACLCTVWAQQLDDDRYRIDIELVPPLARTAVLRCGELLLHADFSSRGRAMLGPVPANLLEADAGPDLEIRCLGLTQ